MARSSRRSRPMLRPLALRLPCLVALRRLPFLLGASLALACSFVSQPTHVLVAYTPPDDHALHEAGESLKLRRWDIDAREEGFSKGFFVVKGEHEWRLLWPATDDSKVPLLPPGLDFSREMLLVMSPTDDNVTGSEIKEVIETEQSGLNVYATQTVPGVDCPRTAEDRDKIKYSLARVRRVDGKEVRFHVDTAHSEPCGEPPRATIACRPNGTTTPFQEKLAVGPATTVACLASGLASSRPIFDRTWTFVSLPKGTLAKMTVGPSGTGVTFTTDVFGTYKLLLEVTDDLSRKGAFVTEIDVVAPKDALVLQLVWTKVDPDADPSTLPHVSLHAIGVSGRDAARSLKWGALRDCSVEADSPPAGCGVKVQGPTTVMKLDPSLATEFAVAAHYVNERKEGQPAICVRAYRDGKMQTELCDLSPHKEGTWWEPGTVDAKTGKTPEMLALEQAEAEERARTAATARAAAAILAAGADGGSKGAAVDAGGGG
jgi:hypothetical protein